MGVLKEIKRVNTSSMAELIEGLPEQCMEADGFAKDTDISSLGNKWEQLVFTGLGGSALGGDILRNCFSNEIKIPVLVNRNYTFPAFVNKFTLFIASSYSGNTEETLSAYRKAKKKKAKILVVASGGKLSKLASKDKVPCISIPKGFPPRSALGYSFFSILEVLSRLGLVKDKAKDIKETVRILASMRENLKPDLPLGKNPAKRLASRLKDRFTILYGAQDLLDSAITRWRCQLAENSKTLASSHLLPEMNHNEIVGWEFPRKILRDSVVVFLRDRGEHPRVHQRIEITKSIIKKEAKLVTEVWSKGNSLLARLFSLIYFGDYVSLYLAVLNKVDPTPVARITYLKNKLGSK